MTLRTVSQMTDFLLSLGTVVGIWKPPTSGDGVGAGGAAGAAIAAAALRAVSTKFICAFRRDGVKLDCCFTQPGVRRPASRTANQR